MENGEDTNYTDQESEQNEQSLQTEQLCEPVVTSTQIAGFWKRILALVLDSILIGVIGMSLGALFFDQFAAMGNWARLIGLAIFLAYFGILNSKYGGGQTLGKRVFKIKVVDEMGDFISLKRSLIRALILGLPGIVNQMSMGPGAMSNPFQLIFWFIVAVILFGGGIGVIYFYIFNRNTRQSLHDLVCGTYVVSTTFAFGPVNTAPVWRGHFITYGVYSEKVRTDGRHQHPDNSIL